VSYLSPRNQEIARRNLELGLRENLFPGQYLTLDDSASISPCSNELVGLLILQFHASLYDVKDVAQAHNWPICKIAQLRNPGLDTRRIGGASLAVTIAHWTPSSLR
jgi:hypothetical protein